MAYIDKTFYFDSERDRFTSDEDFKYDNRKIRIQNFGQLSDWKFLTVRWRDSYSWDSTLTDSEKEHYYSDNKLVSIELWSDEHKEDGSYDDSKDREIMLSLKEALRLSQKLQMAVNEIIMDYKLEDLIYMRNLEELNDLHLMEINELKQRRYEYERELEQKKLREVKNEKDNSEKLSN